MSTCCFTETSGFHCPLSNIPIQSNCLLFNSTFCKRYQLKIKQNTWMSLVSSMFTGWLPYLIFCHISVVNFDFILVLAQLPILLTVNIIRFYFSLICRFAVRFMFDSCLISSWVRLCLVVRLELAPCMYLILLPPEKNSPKHINWFQLQTHLTRARLGFNQICSCLYMWLSLSLAFMWAMAWYF